MMTQATIDRWQVGGDIYNANLLKYGVTIAGQLAIAAKTGYESNINAAFVQYVEGGTLNDSTLDAFDDLITTDPLGAPIDDATTLVTNTAGDIIGAVGTTVKNALGDTLLNPFSIVPIILIGAGVFVFFKYFDGQQIIKKSIGIIP